MNENSSFEKSFENSFDASALVYYLREGGNVFVRTRY